MGVDAPASWLREIRRITAEHGIVMIVDEVQTGVARTGHMYAHQFAGIQPDAVCLSKAIGGGFPLGLVVYDQKWDKWGPGEHAGTFRGNALAMTTGTATLRHIEAEGLVEKTRVR